MKCPQCNLEIQKDWRFCPECNYAFEKAEQQTISQKQITLQNHPHEAKFSDIKLISIKQWGFLILLCTCIYIIGNKFADRIITEPPNYSKIPKESTVKTNQQSYKISGQTAILKDNIVLPFTEKDYDELVRYYTAKNTNAISQMVIKGKAIMVDKGTKVTIVKRGFESSLLEVAEGPRIGARGYMINSLFE